VRNIFEMALVGSSAIRIAERLNRDNVPAPRGGAWRDSTVKAILRNRRYLGEIVYGAHEVRGSAQDSKKRIRTKRAEPLSVRQVPELAIVPRELFDKVQKVRTASLARRDWLCEPFSAVNQPN
jgi:site-specific DNA recombinase